MPVKLICTIILVVLVAVFTGFNLDNRCNIWLFHNFPDVPVVMTILCSFVFGVLVTLPFTFGKGRRAKKASKVSERNAVKPMDNSVEGSVAEEKIEAPKKKLFGKNKNAAAESVEPVVSPEEAYNPNPNQ